MKKVNKNTKYIALTALFAALVCALTTVHLPLPSEAGYVHFGDALVYLVASVMGGPWAFFAAAVGEALADVTAGWVSYAPATLIVKALIALPFVLSCKKSDKILTPLTALLTIPAGVITVGGYFVADLIIDKTYAIVDIPGNVIQAAGSAIIFIVLASALDAVKIKSKIKLEG